MNIRTVIDFILSAAGSNLAPEGAAFVANAIKKNATPEEQAVAKTFFADVAAGL